VASRAAESFPAAVSCHRRWPHCLLPRSKARPTRTPKLPVDAHGRRGKMPKATARICDRRRAVDSIRWVKLDKMATWHPCRKCSRPHRRPPHPGSSERDLQVTPVTTARGLPRARVPRRQMPLTQVTTPVRGTRDLPPALRHRPPPLRPRRAMRSSSRPCCTSWRASKARCTTQPSTWPKRTTIRSRN
jgi:hypothetical protein